MVVRQGLTKENGETCTLDLLSNGPSVWINEQGTLAIRSFADECLKDRDIATRVGVEAVVKIVQEVAQHNFNKAADDSMLKGLVKDEVLKPLRESIRERVVCTPITNLNVKSTITVGAVTFSPHEEGVVQNTTNVIELRPGRSEEERVAATAAFLKTIGNIAGRGSAWATTTISCHESQIGVVARSQIEASINAIRAFTRVFHSRNLPVAFGLPHELHAESSGFIAKSKSGLNIQFDHKGSFVPFNLTQSVIDKLEKSYSFSELSRLSGTDWKSMNSFERAIRVAISWLGRSVVAATPAESFAHCVIAIERLLIVDGEAATTERFADRLAYLLAGNKVDRLELNREAKRLYDVRSKIVHAGFEGVQEYQLAAIEGMAIGAIRETAGLIGQFDDHQKFQQHLHEIKMG